MTFGRTLGTGDGRTYCGVGRGVACGVDGTTGR